MDSTQFLKLPPEQRKEFQRELKRKGLYMGPIDGKGGDGMQAAFDAISKEKADSATNATRQSEIELEREKLRATQEAATRKANEERDERERKAREKSEREAKSDPLMDTFLPWAGGGLFGMGYGELTNRGLDYFQKGNRDALVEIGRELGPTRNLTTSQLNRSRAAGAAKAAERFAPTSPVKQGLGAAGRLASYGIPAALFYNEYHKYQERASDEKATDTERNANQRIANGLLGAATGIGVEGGRRFFFPSRGQGLGTAQMRIDAARDFAERMDKADAAKAARPTMEPEAESRPLKTIDAEPEAPKRALPPPEAETPPPEAETTAKAVTEPRAGTGRDLMRLARLYKVPNRTDMSVEELRGAVAEAIKNSTGKRPKISGAVTKALKSPAFAPLAAGALAYELAGDPAEASSDGGTPPMVSDKVKAGGTAAATAYGLGRVVNALPQAAKTAISTAGDVFAPSNIDAMTDQFGTDEARNAAARYLPSFMQFGAVKEAADKSQVPERNPLRTTPMPGNQYYPLASGNAPSATNVPNDDFESALNDIQMFMQQQQGMVSP